MGEYRCLLLGQPRIEGPGGPVHLTALKAQALLWYLAAQPERLFPRAHLAALLWEETSEADGRNNLSTTLTRLRQSLPFWPLQAVGDNLGWATSCDVAVDAGQFRRLPPEQAVELWRGPFLDGFHLPQSEAFEAWLQQERQDWERRILEALAHLAESAEAAADWKGAIRFARQALAVDPLQERFHRTLMIAYCQTGDRAAALAQYAACERIIGEELGLDPDPATDALRTAIVMGEIAPAPAPAAAQPPATPAPQQPAIPLAERTAELHRLEEALGRALGGEGQLILIHGEAGIGKTRLIEEALWRLRRPDSPAACRTLALGRCYETAHGLPYAPFVEAMTDLLARLDLTALHLPDIWLAEVRRLLPDIALLRPGLPTPPPLEPGQERRRLFEGLARFLGAVPRPFLLVLEDLHWADEATLLLLAYLLRQPATRGVSIIATVRAGEMPDPLEPLLAELRRDGRLAWIGLEALSPTGIRSLVRSLTGRDDPALSDHIHTETQGNPLFAVELLRTLDEQGAGAPLPRTVQAVIRGRLARLSRPGRDLANAAALFPRGAALPVLQDPPPSGSGSRR